MARTKWTNDLAFVGRQLAARSRDRGMEAAVRDLEAGLPERYQPALERLKAISTGEGHPDDHKRSAWSTLHFLAKSVSANREQLFAEYNELVERNQTIVSGYWAGALSSMSYLAVVAAVTAVVSFIFVRFTVPGFGYMFESFGAELPALTKFMLQFDGILPIAISAAILALVVGVFLVVQRINTCLRTLQPANGFIARLPIADNLVTCHQEGLFIEFTRLLRNCGLDADSAILTAASVSGLSPAAGARLAGTNDVAPLSNRLMKIAIADRLHTLDDELEYQCDRQPDLMTAALVSAHGEFSLVIKTVLFVFVGLMVIAMYLPIFGIGSVI